MQFSTCDLCDANEDKLQDGSLLALPPVLQRFGKRHAFAGPAVTLKVFEDNVLVRAALEQQGEGRILLVDGGGSLRCALVGGNLAVLAEKNGWSGMIVNGCVRDSDEINQCDIGVRALATHPQRSIRKGLGESGIKIQIAGVAVHPDDWVYADSDGVLISRSKLV